MKHMVTKVSVLWICIALSSGCSYTMEKSGTNPQSLRERDLQATIELMEARKNRNNERFVELMKSKEITAPRLKENLNDITLLMPYVYAEENFASAHKNDSLDEKQKKALKIFRDSTKKVAERHFGKTDIVSVGDFDETIGLLRKYRKQIQDHIPSFLEREVEAKPSLLSEGEIRSKKRSLNERELKVTIELMKAQQNMDIERFKQLMKSEHVTVDRYKEILSDVAILMPYVNSKALNDSPNKYKELNENQKSSLSRIQESTKQVAEKHILESRNLTEKDFNKTIVLLGKYRKQIQDHIISSLEPAGEEVNHNLVQQQNQTVWNENNKYAEEESVTPLVMMSGSSMETSGSSMETSGTSTDFSVEFSEDVIKDIATRIGPVNQGGSYTVSISSTCFRCTDTVLGVCVWGYFYSCQWPIYTANWQASVSLTDADISTNGVSYDATVVGNYGVFPIYANATGNASINASGGNIQFSMGSISVPLDLNLFGQTIRIATINRTLPYSFTLPITNVRFKNEAPDGPQTIYGTAGSLSRQYLTNKVLISGKAGFR